MDGLTALAPGAGVAGLVLFLVGLLFRILQSERKDYRTAIDDLRRELDDERSQRAACQVQVDVERTRRRKAEDDLTSQVGSHAADVLRLQLAQYLREDPDG